MELSEIDNFKLMEIYLNLRDGSEWANMSNKEYFEKHAKLEELLGEIKKRDLLRFNPLISESKEGNYGRTDKKGDLNNRDPARSVTGLTTKSKENTKQRKT